METECTIWIQSPTHGCSCGQAHKSTERDLVHSHSVLDSLCLHRIHFHCPSCRGQCSGRVVITRLAGEAAQGSHTRPRTRQPKVATRGQEQGSCTTGQHRRWPHSLCAGGGGVPSLQTGACQQFHRSCLPGESMPPQGWSWCYQRGSRGE